MAADETTRGSFTQTGDTRPAAGAMNPALGRTSRDLAADEPAGFGPDPIAATDADTFSDADTDTNDRGEPLRGRERKFNPDIPPDERLGLRPTVAGDAVPDYAPYPESRAATRMASGFVAGIVGAGAVVGLTYLLMLARVVEAPSFFYTSRSWLGDRGTSVTHALGVFGSLIAGGLWGLLFGLIVRKPTPAKGMIFGLLPAALTFLLAPMGSRPLMAALVLSVFVYGFLLGRLASWWLRPPSSSDTTPG
jgi:hypothetical protein